MVKLEASVLIDRPVEEVWKFMIDMSNCPKYDPGVISAKQTSDGPVAVGTTFEADRKKEGKVSFRTVECDPGRKLTLEVTSPRALERSKESVVIEGIEGKTKLTHAWDLRLSGFYRLAGPFVARSIRKLAGTQVSNVKRILESEAK